MAIPFFTGKFGRYVGKGDPPGYAVIGEHSKGHSIVPFLPHAAVLTGKIAGFHGCGSYVAADFTETKENSGTVAMSADGLLFTTGAANGNSCNIQAVRAGTLAAGKKMIAFSRFAASDNVNAGWVFGVHVTDSDYWSTEPTHQAVFFKDKGAASNAVVGRTKDGTTGSNVATFNATDGEFMDLAVLVNPGTGVQFFYRTGSTSAWSSTALKTTNLPAAGQVLRLTLNIENDTAGSGETLTVGHWGCYWEV